MKKCSKCKQVKEFIEFGKNKSTKDGYQSWCKLCKKKADKSYNNRNKEYKLEQDRFRYSGFAKYLTFENQINFAETVQESNFGFLEVKCAYCGKFFLPTQLMVRDCIRALKGQTSSFAENRFYCSDSCKKLCPTFNKHKHSRELKLATEREVQPELRQLVFQRDNWTCQKCNKKEDLHCHHIEGIRWNPLESLDLDQCLTVCGDCHRQIHQIDGCRYHEFKC